MLRESTFILAFLAAGLCQAGEMRRETLTFSIGTNAAALTNITTKIAPGLIGKIDEILLDVPSGATGNVTVAIAPELSTMADRSIYTNEAIVADTLLVPVVQAKDITGTVISGVYQPFTMFNDAFKVTWSNAGAGGVTIKAIIKYSKGE